MKLVVLSALDDEGLVPGAPVAAGMADAAIVGRAGLHWRGHDRLPRRGLRRPAHLRPLRLVPSHFRFGKSLYFVVTTWPSRTPRAGSRVSVVPLPLHTWRMKAWVQELDAKPVARLILAGAPVQPF